MFGFTNCLIYIFVNINENIRNERKITEKLKCVPTKLPIYKLLTILDYQK